MSTKPGFIPAILLTLSLLTGLMSVKGHTETWNEPWHKEVLTQADSLALVEFAASSDTSVTLRVLRVLAGKALPPEIQLQSPVQVTLTSASGNSAALKPWIKEKQQAYVLLQQAGESWRLLSPSAGIDLLFGRDQVAATYRISFHQLPQATADYERLQPCLFQVIQGQQCELATLADLLLLPLQEPAAGLGPDISESEAQRFFRQHVALESSYLLQSALDAAQLEPFLQHDFFHTQISAVRALAVLEGAAATTRLVDFISDPTRTGVARAMAVLMLAERGDATALHQLRDQINLLGGLDEESYLPLPNFMDPRIGTYYPETVRQALELVCTEPFPCLAQKE